KAKRVERHVPLWGLGHRRVLYLIGAGLCTGLACDLAPGLWLVPLTIAGFLLVWRWLRPDSLQVSRATLVLLIGTALVSRVPTLWHFASRAIGFPARIALLAPTTLPTHPSPPILSSAFS